MVLPDWLCIVAHVAFWFPYIVRGRLDSMRGRDLKTVTATHPKAGRFVLQHTLVTVGLCIGMGIGIRDAAAWAAWPGLGFILLGTGLSLWTLWVFRSWRIRAEIGADHELCTSGPFAVVRHPIYTAMTLLGLGTAVWFPNGLTIGGLVGIAWIGDQRARAEEALLMEGFGEAYRSLMARTWRFVPWVY